MGPFNALRLRCKSKALNAHHSLVIKGLNVVSCSQASKVLNGLGLETEGPLSCNKRGYDQKST